MSKAVVNQIVRTVGGDRIAKEVGVGAHSVRNAKWKGKFPSKWYPAVKALCDVEGIECPPVAFSFKPATAEAVK